MKALLPAIAGGMFLLAAPVSPVGAQTTANGPYYATPSWDQTLPTATRFVVLSNFDSQAVLDRETGLVWHRAAGNSAPYSEARDRCQSSGVGNRGGWRLPTQPELATLFDPSARSGPPLPAGHPFTGFNTFAAALITNSVSARGPTYHDAVQYAPSLGGAFSLDLSVGYESTSSTDFICVRGPGG